MEYRIKVKAKASGKFEYIPQKKLVGLFWVRLVDLNRLPWFHTEEEARQEIEYSKKSIRENLAWEQNNKTVGVSYLEDKD
jgi:hypothetical protein